MGHTEAIRAMPPTTATTTDQQTPSTGTTSIKGASSRHSGKDLSTSINQTIISTGVVVKLVGILVSDGGKMGYWKGMEDLERKGPS